VTGADKLLIVTADDLGLSPEVNRGIVEGHERGIVTSASLLVNAPATDDAVALARRHPGLEVGLHLSVVEGISLRGVESTLTDSLRYFDGRICLHRNWRRFLSRYLLSRIDLGELEEELELQVQAFLRHFDAIPFANCTQHLHLLPGVREIVLRLAVRHRIGALRAAPFSDRTGRIPGPRGLAAMVLNALAARAQRAARAAGIRTADRSCGFATAGHTREADVLHAIAAAGAGAGASELVAHPGNDAPALRRQLPWAYRDYRWQEELSALSSPAVRGACRQHNVQLARFSELAAHRR
jgi:chitin disaccharide deacetylase